LGGPIKQNRSFFFINYEGLAQNLGETIIATVPSAAARAQATHPYVIQVLNAIPLPNGIDNGNGTGQRTTVATQHASENYFNGRWDYTLNNTDSITARYIFDHADLKEPFGNPLAQYPQHGINRNQFYTFGWKKAVSSRLINDLRFYLSRLHQQVIIVDHIPAFQCNPQNQGDCAFVIPGLTTVGLNTNGVPYFNYIQTKYEYSDQVFWQAGTHSITFGGSVRRPQSMSDTPVQAAGNWRFSAYGFNAAGGSPLANSFLSGQPNQFAGSRPGQDDSRRDFREIDFTGFIQDDWKVTTNLTANVGVRYELATNPVEVNNKLTVIPDPRTSPGYVSTRNVFAKNPSLKNFNPRIGVAWSPFADSKTVVRSGFGLFHDVYEPRIYGIGFSFTPPMDQSAVNFPPFVNPVVFVSTQGNTAIVPTTHDVLAYDVGTTTPYTVQYNVNIQRVLPANITITVGYIGSRGVNLLAQQELNPPTNSGTAQNPQFAQLINGALVTNPRTNPNFAALGMIAPGAESSYNALQTTFNKSLTYGLQFQGNYQLSKCIDTSSTLSGAYAGGYIAPPAPYSLDYNRGRCSFDRHQNFVTTTLYDLPFKENRFVSGWQLSSIVSLRSGLPFTVQTGFDSPGLQEQIGSPNIPNLAPNRTAKDIILGDPAKWYDPTAFLLPTPGTIGNLGRNAFDGPPFKNLDVALLKRTKLNESINMEFRTEVFNVFNHPNFGNPNTSVFTGATGALNRTAGLITTTTTTSRQFQFALKFVF